MSSVNEKVRKAAFSKLRSLRRKLNAQGVPCTYSRSVLSHQDEDNAFKITILANGNNGDTSLLPSVSIRTGESVEEFDHAAFEQGIVRIKEVFYAHDDHDDV